MRSANLNDCAVLVANDINPMDARCLHWPMRRWEVLDWLLCQVLKESLNFVLLVAMDVHAARVAEILFCSDLRFAENSLQFSSDKTLLKNPGPRIGRVPLISRRSFWSSFNRSRIISALAHTSSISLSDSRKRSRMSFFGYSDSRPSR